MRGGGGGGGGWGIHTPASNSVQLHSSFGLPRSTWGGRGRERGGGDGGWEGETETDRQTDRQTDRLRYRYINEGRNVSVLERGKAEFM